VKGTQFDTQGVTEVVVTEVVDTVDVTELVEVEEDVELGIRGVPVAMSSTYRSPENWPGSGEYWLVIQLEG